jgi:hypothetical protein
MEKKDMGMPEFLKNLMGIEEYGEYCALLKSV